MYVSVNVSARQLDNEHLVGDLTTALESAGLDPSALVIEITETAIMRDAEMTARQLRVVKELGVGIAIDDFGTGYSSLAYLRQFPVDILKIDRSFISPIADSAESRALLHTLVQLGKQLGLKTLAEGIEEHDQFCQLQHEQCDSGQGFMFARPLAASERCGLPRRPPRSPAPSNPQRAEHHRLTPRCRTLGSWSGRLESRGDRCRSPSRHDRTGARGSAHRDPQDVRRRRRRRRHRPRDRRGRVLHDARTVGLGQDDAAPDDRRLRATRSRRGRARRAPT